MITELSHILQRRGFCAGSAGLLQNAHRPGLRRTLVALLLVPLASALYSVPARSVKPAYSLSFSPEKPASGGILAVDLLFPNEPDLEAGKISTNALLSLESVYSTAEIEPRSGRRGTRLSLRFRVLAEGSLSIDTLEVKIPRASFNLGPVTFESAGAALLKERSGWTWAAPASVWCYESFLLGLEHKTGQTASQPSAPATAPPAGTSLDFLPPPGAIFEPHGGCAWTVTVLGLDSLTVPDTELKLPSGPVSLAGFTIAVKPLPEAVSQSRAVGRFSCRLEGPGFARGAGSWTQAGDARKGSVGTGLLFRLSIAGEGNLPILRFPELQVARRGPAGGQTVLPAKALKTERSDAIRAGPSGYRGTSTLLLSLIPDRSGTYIVQSGPFSYLEPQSGKVFVISPQPISVEVGAAAESGVVQDPFAGDRANSAADARTAEAAALWKAGGASRGRALSIVYGLARANPFNRRYAALAAACELASAAGPRIRDSLLPPEVFFWLCIILGAALLVCCVLLFREGRGTRAGASRRPSSGAGRACLKDKPSRAIPAALCLILCLVSLGFCLAARAERSNRYAVLWCDEALAVPSPLSEGRLPVVPGQSARISGDSGDYFGIRLADGSLGWVLSDSVYFY